MRDSLPGNRQHRSGDDNNMDNDTSAQPQLIVMGAARRDPRGGVAYGAVSCSHLMTSQNRGVEDK